MRKYIKQKISTVTLGIVFGFMITVGYGQSVYWNEDFKTLPDWLLGENWNAYPGQILFQWEPVITPFDISAISPQIYLDDHVQSLVINQFVDVFANSPDEFAEISILTEDGEFPVWEFSLEEGDWGVYGGSDTSFSLLDYQDQQIQIKFRTWGTTTLNWNGWNIYNVSILASYDQDLAITSISGPNKLEILENGSWDIDVANFGNTALNNFEIGLSDLITGEILGSINESTELLPGDTRNYSIDWMPFIAKNTLVFGWLESTDDQFAGNNQSRNIFLRIQPEQDISILFWDNDNNIQDIISPETGQHVTAADGFKMVLDDAGLTYEKVPSLPENIEGYDIILSTMGSFCLS